MPLFPKCGRCNLSFNIKDSKNPHGSRLPLMLDCGHTFCSDCLSRLARQQRTCITCPKCSKSTSLIEDCSINTLWTNMYVSGLLMANRSGLPLLPQMQEFSKLRCHSNVTKPKHVNCEECAVKAAKCRCIKCDVLLCGSCFEKIHSVSNVLRQHQAEPYTSRTTDITYGDNQLLMCNIHRCVNEYYCNEEDVAFCSKCVAQGLHKDHSVIALEDKEKRDSGDLNAIFGQATSVINQTKQSFQLLRSFETACQSHGSRLVEKLQDHFLQLHSSLQAREYSLINELINLFQSDIGSLAEMEENLQEKVKKMEVISQDAKSVIAGTNKHLTSIQLMEHVKEIVENPCHATVAGCGNLGIQFQCEDDKLFGEIRSHGQWEGKFVNEIKFNKLCDVPSNAEFANCTPLLASSSENSSGENSASESYGGSDVNGVSLNSDPEFVSVDDNKPLPKNDNGVNAKDKPKTGNRFKIRSEVIHVSHIYDPCNFYVNLSRDIPTLTSLSLNINSHCSHGGRWDVPNAVGVGDQVLAQFGQDGQWYRAQVVEIYDKTPTGPSTYKVLYTDYGNTELIELDRIRNTHPKFLQLPKMAKRCSLVDIVPVGVANWSNEAILTFARVTKDRPMILCLIKETPDLWYIDLSRPASEEIEDDGPASVRDVLIFLNLACFMSPYSLPLAKTGGGIKRRQYLTPILPQFGDSVRVSLTYVVSPHDFYVHLIGSDTRHLGELMVTMKKTYDADHGDLYTLFCPAKGMLCVAKYGSDDMWYRAEVVELVGSGQVNIRYVDYGNNETLSIWKLKKLLDAYMILPAQAVHCRLADITPLDESGLWPKEATEFFTKMFNEPELSLKVKEIINRSVLSVYVHSELLLHSVNTSLISNGWAVATGPGWEPPPKTAKSLYKISQSQKNRADNDLSKLKTKDMRLTDVVQSNKNDTALANGKSEQEKPHGPAVSVCHVESPGEFYVQVVDDIKALQQLMADLNSFFVDDLSSDSPDDMDSSKADWKLGDLCAINNPNDQLWYRVRIKNILKSPEPSAEVSCVDFGYKSVVTLASLRPIPDHLNSAMRFATCCHFVDVVPAGDPIRWSQTSCDTLKSLVADKTFYLTKKDALVNESDSLPADLVFEMKIKGGAVTPDTVSYHSVSDTLRDRGLALKKRVVCQAVRCAEGQQKPALNVPPVSVAVKELETVSAQKPDLEDSLDDYPPPELPSSEKLVLGVTHVDRDCVIYGQEIKKDLRPLQELTDHVQSHYKNSLPNIGYEWKVGQKVVAQYTMDDGFYRAKILSVSDNFAEVYFVDYGNSERLSTERLRLPLYTDKPVQCYKCVMPGLKWISLEKTSKFLYTLLVGKFCDVHIQKQSEFGLPLVVNIVSPETNDLAQYLCDHDYAAKEEALLEEKATESDSFTVDELKSDTIVGEVMNSVIDNSSSSASPLQQTPSESSEKISSKASTVSSIPSIPSIPSFESLQSLSAAVLASSSDSFPPAFPHPCGYGNWMGDIDNFQVTTDPSCLPRKKQPSPYLQPLDLKLGDVKMMTVTQVDAPNMVYLQNVKLENVNKESLLEINRQLDCLLEMNMWYGSHIDECPVLTREQLTPGLPCIAKYSLDNCWYRAEIIDVQPSEELLNVFVLFVDYGSSESITQPERLLVIPTDHLTLPAQAVLCRLNGVVPRNNWSQEDVDYVDQSVKDKVLVAVFKNVENSQMSVDLYDQEVYASESGVVSLVYKSLIDDGILTLAAENVLLTSMQQETSSESSSLEFAAVKCSSKSSSKPDDMEDIDAND